MDQNRDTGHFLSSGVPGLDTVLSGGFTRDRLYLVEGEPGTGKTTLALQFLTEGLRQGESVLYITLAETSAELAAVACSHGWSIDGIHVEEIITDQNALDPEQQYSIFHPSEIELGTTTQRILAAVEKYQPTRVALDSLSELQLLAENALRYRRQVLALKQYLASRNCTTIFLDDRTALNTDLQVRSVAHGVITLSVSDQAYGNERRHLRVVKYRGIAFSGGAHDYRIIHGGLRVYPRLVAADSRVHKVREQLSTGLAELDTMLGGGIEEGSSTLVAGPPGCGKSTVAAQCISAASRRGTRCAMFLFEESRNNLLNRCDGMGMGLYNAIAEGLLSVQQIDPAELTPGQFTQSVIDAAESDARVIVIDSLNGYLNAVPDERFMALHLHELLTYLGQRGIVTIVVGVHAGLIGGAMTSAADASYLADNVVMLRYFEAEGEVRQAISIFKKRGSSHERTLRRFTITQQGPRVGAVLNGFPGVLTGLPTTVTPAFAPASAPSPSK